MPLMILAAVLALKIIKGILGSKNLNNRYYLHGEFFDKITSLHYKSRKLVITNALDY